MEKINKLERERVANRVKNGDRSDRFMRYEEIHNGLTDEPTD